MCCRDSSIGLPATIAINRPPLPFRGDMPTGLRSCSSKVSLTESPKWHGNDTDDAPCFSVSQGRSIVEAESDLWEATPSPIGLDSEKLQGVEYKIGVGDASHRKTGRPCSVSLSPCLFCALCDIIKPVGEFTAGGFPSVTGHQIVGGRAFAEVGHALARRFSRRHARTQRKALAAAASSAHRDGLGEFVPGKPRIRYQLDVSPEAPHQELLLEQAGPSERNYFDPFYTTAAIVTCGGLCPGLNNVIRSIYLELSKNYGVRNVIGIRNGYLGLNPASGLAPIPLTDGYVSEIHKLGGTVLGSSRGPQDPATIVNFLHRQGINILFCVGGDGTHAAPIRSTKRLPAADSRSRWSASPRPSTTTSCTCIARSASPPRSKLRSRP